MFSIQTWDLTVESNSWKENFSALVFFGIVPFGISSCEDYFHVSDKAEKVIG